MRNKIFFLLIFIFLNIIIINHTNANNFDCKYINEKIEPHNSTKIYIDKFFKKLSKNNKKKDIYTRIYKIIEKKFSNLKKDNKNYLMIGYISCLNKENIRNIDVVMNLKHNKDGVKFYQDILGEFSVLDIDLNVVKISFAGIKYNNSNGRKLRKYIRFYPDDKNFTSDVSFFKNKKIISLVNGQFFDPRYTTTSLSFPLKAEGIKINSYVDNETSKRTFVINNIGEAKILKGYKKEFLEDKNNKQVIVSFIPKIKARSNQRIGRTYIGIKSPKNILFFIAKNKTQKQMNKIISDYGIKSENIIMMDGGSSSQFSFNKENELEKYYGEGKVPHYFVIYND